MSRFIFLFVGGLLLSATAHATIVKGGGYGTPDSFIVISIACGVAVGSVGVGLAFAEKRTGLAIGIILALVAGEGYQLLMTGERVIAAREAQQVPLRAANELRSSLQHRITDLEEQEAKLTTTPRLKTALEAQRKAQMDVGAKAALRGCAKNCRKLLEDARDQANNEVAQARSELTAQQDALAGRLGEDRRKLSALPKLGTGTPLADRLGVEPWTVDILAAALASIAANGLGCLLLALGAHKPQHRAREMAMSVAELPRSKPHCVVDHVDIFAGNSISARKRGKVRLTEARRAYQQWCAHNDMEPLSPGDFADALAKLVKEAGLSVKFSDGDPLIEGVTLVEMVKPATGGSEVGPVRSK